MTLVTRHALGTHYTARETADLARITYRQLDYWVRVEALQAEVDARGSGSRRLFTLDQVVVAAVGGALARGSTGHGHVEAIRTLARTTLARDHDLLYLGPHGWWAIDPVVYRDEPAAETLVRVDVARIRARVAADADEMVAKR